MFIAHPQLTFQQIQLPYASKLFYDLCGYRDAHCQSMIHRIHCQIGFIGIGLLALIESIVRACIAFCSSCFSQKEKRIYGMYMAGWTLVFSVYAVARNLFVSNLSNEIIRCQWNLQQNLKNQFLFTAFEYNRKDLILDLVNEYKADPHDVHANPIGKERISPALVPHLVGNTALIDLFPLNDFEKKYLELKIVSHWLGLRGTVKLHGEEIEIDSGFTKLFAKSIAETFREFCKSPSFKLVSLSKEKAAQIEESFRESYEEQPTSKIVQRVQENKLTFIHSGWDGHGICLCLFGNYLAVGNRGETDKKKSTIEVYQIDPKKMTGSLVEEIWSHQYMPAQCGMNYFYTTLPGKLSATGRPEQNSLCHSFRSIVPNYPPSGTCALTSKKAALRFAWAMLLSDHPSQEDLKRARLESKLYTCWTAWKFFRESTLIKELNDDSAFVKQYLEKGHKKIAKFQKVSNQLWV